MRCAIYCRLSREDEDRRDESESIKNQKSLLTEYADSKGWEIYRIYCDEDYSGADSDRPAFRAMLEDAEKHLFRIILCKTQSRFTRDMEVAEHYLHGLFPVWGIRFVSVADNVDTDIRSGKKARQIGGLVNEWYLEDLSDSIRAVLDNKRRKGLYIGSFPLYGYMKDPSGKGKLAIDEEAAAVVRLIFSLALQGHGKQSISDTLNRRGIPNPTLYKQLSGQNYVNGSGTGGGFWSKNTVGRILKNEMYTGTMVQGRRRKPNCKMKTIVGVPPAEWFRVEGTHEAIVDKKTFSLVARQMASRSRTDGIGKRHALSGKVFCMTCGTAMSKTSTTYKGQKRSYLRCRNTACRADSVGKRMVRLDDLEAIVADQVRMYISLSPALDDGESLGKCLGSAWDTSYAAEKERQAIDNRISKYTAAMNSLYLDRVSGLIDERRYSEMNASFSAERDQLEKRLALIQEESAGRSGSPAPDEIVRLLAVKPLTSALLTLLIDKVEIGTVRPDSGAREIKIHWRF